LQPSDGMILVIDPRLEDHSVIFLAIQTHPSCRFHLAVDSLGLRRAGIISVRLVHVSLWLDSEVKAVSPACLFYPQLRTWAAPPANVST